MRALATEKADMVGQVENPDNRRRNVSHIGQQEL